MKIIGITELLINGKTVFKKHNDITHWIERATLQGNFANSLLSSKLYPLRQWFAGCFLFSANMDSELIVNTCVPTDEAIVVAQAGDATNYDGKLATMGSYMPNESGAVKETIDNIEYRGWRNVWQWGTGVSFNVGAVGLTRAVNGQCPMTTRWNDEALNDGVYPFEVLSGEIRAASSDANINNIVGSINCIDYEKELGFIIGYNYNEGRGTVRIRTYRMNTKQVHLDGETACIIPDSASKYEIDDITFDTNLDLSNQYAFTYTGNYIFIYPTDVYTIPIIKVSTEDWSWSISTHNLSSLGGVHGAGLRDIKDSIPMEYEEENGTVTKWNAFITQKEGNPIKFLKVNLLTNELIKEYTRADEGIGLDYAQMLPCIILPNGDFLRWQVGRGIANYYSKADDKFFAVFCPTGTGTIPQDIQAIIGCGDYGTALIKAGNYMRLVQFRPYLSTINNLDSLVRKQDSDVMQLRYTILEQEDTSEE